MKDKKLKIAFIHPDLGIGGAERLVLDVAAALSKEGHKVRFITNHFDKSHAFDELKNGHYSIEIYGDWLPRSVCGKFYALCAYLRMIYLSIVYLLFFRKNDKPDLYFIDLIPIAIPFLKLVNERVVYYCHHPDLLASNPGGKLKRFYRKPIDWLELKATAQADVILVNSEYTASVFRETFPQIIKSIDILYPTISSSYEKTVEDLKKETKQQGTKKNEEVVFLSINRFHPAKKLELAILAMDKLKTLMKEDKWKNISFILAGGYDPQSQVNSDTYSDLVNLAREKNLLDKVTFLKSPSDNLKANLLNSCTCLVYTPVKEHFGIVPLEAMLVAKPVIAVNSGGPRETIDHGITGYLCQPTPESMAEFMYRIAAEDNTYEMGLNGKKRLDEKFSNRIFSNRLNKIIKTLTESNGTKAK